VATLAIVNANSLDTQVDQLTKSFAAVQKAGSLFEGQERRTRDLLFAALTDVYEFGEAIYAIKPAPGTSLFREFLVKMSEKTKIEVLFNKKCRENPYIGLVKLAFPSSSASSQSQYATVLDFAHSEKLDPADFKEWIEAGIETRRDEALEAKGSRQRQIANQARTAQIANAETVLKAMPASASVALPAGISMPDGFAGFALVLAKIDGSNNASIVQMVHTEAEKVDPVLLRLVDPKANDRSDEALVSFFRAVDLILSTTPDETAGKSRDLLIRNEANHGRQRAVVQAISEANSFPGAAMDLEGHIEGLPVDVPFVLRADDARQLLALLNNYSGWKFDETGLLTATGLANPVHLDRIETAGSFRVANPGQNDGKGLAITHDEFNEVFAYIQREREAHADKRGKSKEKRVFPAVMDLSIDGTRLVGKLPTSLLSVTIAETNAETDLDDTSVTVADLEALAGAMKLYEADADGWLLDVPKGVDNAAIVVEAYVKNDRLRVVLPTKTGSSYNQVCEALTL
jgi:hypothetical protein